jgi:hypothetical protein
VLVDDFNPAKDLAVHLCWWFDSLYIGSYVHMAIRVNPITFSTQRGKMNRQA